VSEPARRSPERGQQRLLGTDPPKIQGAGLEATARRIARAPGRPSVALLNGQGGAIRDGQGEAPECHPGESPLDAAGLTSRT